MVACGLIFSAITWLHANGLIEYIIVKTVYVPIIHSLR